MKKFFRLFWQLFLFPVLYFPYSYLNRWVIAPWLGCGCPRMGADGQLIESSFDANDFTWFFWWGIALVVMVVSVVQMRRIRNWKKRLLYLIVSALVCAITVPAFFQSMFLN